MTNNHDNSGTEKTISKNILIRFGGIARLYGNEVLAKLYNSHVLVIGIGGVGSWAAEALARSGVGEITLMDLDDVCVTNSNRQIHALQSSVGKAKTDVMKARLLDINPELTVHLINDFLDGDNIEEYVDSRYHVVIDAIDMVMVKTKLLSHCKRRKIFVVTTGSAGGKRDPLQVTVSDLSKTKNDPLLSKVRNNLRRLYGFSRNPSTPFSIRAVYSSEQMVYPNSEGGVGQSKEFLDEGAKLDCNLGFGAATMITANFGFVAANEAIKRISRK